MSSASQSLSRSLAYRRKFASHCLHLTKAVPSSPSVVEATTIWITTAMIRTPTTSVEIISSRMGDHYRLSNTGEYHAESSQDKSEKAKLFEHITLQ
jgi:hypothetical protein